MADVNVNFVLGNDEPIRADFQLEPDVTYTAEIVTSTMSGNHPELRGRDLPNQHPMGAITGLEDALEGLSDDITAEYNRAIEAEEALDNKIDLEVDTRADEITRVERLISDEETRAEGVEQGLRDDLTAEVNRATNAEDVLQDNITAEETRASEAETTLQANITAEENRAKGVEQQLSSSIDSNHQAISNHVSNKNNPHEVTKAQVGLGNVENLAPADMPMSTATKTYVDNADTVLQGQINTINTTIGGYGNIVTHDVNEFATASQGALADTALQPNDNISELTNNLNYQTATQVANSIAVETSNRESADNSLQSQIDAIVSASDVFDIVGTYAELQAYDISTVPVNDIIKVLEDSTHGGAATYYRCVENNNVKSWSYIGSEGAYYTKGEADNKFVPQTRTVNNKALSSDITLTANDVGALPSSTVIPTVNDATVTIQKNGGTVSTFTLNQSSNETVNITVPTTTSELTNDSGFITSSSLPTVNNGQLDIQVNGTSVATFTANQSGNTTADITIPSSLPDQTGNAGKVLGTDGTDASWQYIIKPYVFYDNSTQYYPGDVVRHMIDGGYHKYLCIEQTQGNAPDYNSRYWLEKIETPIKQSAGDHPILMYERSSWSGDTISKIKIDIATGTGAYANQPTINATSGLMKVPGGIDGYYTSAQVDTALTAKQDTLVSGTNIKTINGNSVLGSGDITISGGGIQNTATGTDSLTILGNATSYGDSINIGDYSSANGVYAVAIGGQSGDVYYAEASANGTSVGAGAGASCGSVAVGYQAQTEGSNNIAVGRDTYIDSDASSSVAIGNGASVTGEGNTIANSIQLGSGTNSTANSLQVGSYELLDTSTGLIPDARISTNIARVSDIPTVDGVTIDTNSDDELEAIGTVNKNTAVGATAVKYDWIGTLAEYNSQNVETLHPEWVCFITDDVSGGTSVYTKTETDTAISTALDNVYTKSAVDTLISGLLANTTSTVTSNYIRLGDWLVHWGISSTFNVPASGFASQQITLSPAFANSGYTVILNHIDAGGGYANTVPQANSRTPNSFEIYCWGQGGAGVTNIAWIAIGKGA